MNIGLTIIKVGWLVFWRITSRMVALFWETFLVILGANKLFSRRML